MGIAHWAPNLVCEVIRRECEDVDDECQRLLLWASMLKEWTTSKKASVQVREWHLNAWEELLERQWAAINELDSTS
jgi:hypothetical protein